MAQTRKIRRLRGGDSRSNGNVQRNADALKKTVEPSEAKAQLMKQAEGTASRRWDYSNLMKNIEKNILTIKRANEDMEAGEKKRKRIINEEFIKLATAWKLKSTRKKGWFY